MTAADPRIARVEASLAAACETALARGAVLIRGDFEVAIRSAPWEASGVGVCVLRAGGLYGSDDNRDLALEADEYDGIEMGWDGEAGWLRAHEAVRPWWEAGARLAKRFTPVPANSLEAR